MKNNKKLLIIAISIIGIIIIFCAVLMIIAVSSPTESAIQTAIAETNDDMPEPSPLSTYTFYPTYTPNIIVVTATESPTPLFTPTITNTATITQTPSKTATITNTVTNTKEPGIGAELSCGDQFVVKVLEPPRKESYFYGSKPGGEFWLLKVQITNLTGSMHNFNEGDFGIMADFNGESLVFESNWDATFDWVYHNWGALVYPHDEVGPTLTATVGLAFDVNPDVENAQLIWAPRDNMFDSFEDALCVVRIPFK